MDRIIIKGLRVFAYHGVNEEEKIDGQNFEIDVTMHTSLQVPGNTDKVEDTVSYSKACKTIIRVLTEKSYDLLEKVATRVAEQILIEYPSIQIVDVKLKKPEAPVNANFKYMAIEISRSRNMYDF